MTITTTLADADGGTDVLLVYEGLPRGVPIADNETGTRMALAKLAALVEAGRYRQLLARLLTAGDLTYRGRALIVSG